ncbi:MAG: hypothetical protein H6622_11270 [Halobacteriovoraceae bacterium]|nr:hypothetical protein [Halobacteriovoraceae bacterium]
MKALFISQQKDKWELFTNLFNAHFSKIVLRPASAIPELVESLSTESDIGPIIIDTYIEIDILDFMVAINDLVGERPVIFFGSHSKLKQKVTDELFNSHQDNAFIYDPINKQQFIDAITPSVDWKTQENFEDSLVELSLDDFLPMKIKNFYYFDSFPYDVYLQITPKKFVKLIAKDTKYSHSMVQSYVKKKVKYFHVAKEDQLQFLEETILSLSRSLKNKNVPLKNTINTQIFSASIIHQYVRIVGISETLRMFVNILMDSTFHVFKKTQELTSILKEFETNEDTVGFGTLAIMTAYVSDVMLHKMGWNSSLTRKKVMLASLLLDSTLTNDDLLYIDDQNSKEFEQLDEEDQQALLNHPKAAGIIATQFTKFPDTDFLIIHHHESPDGKGYPYGLLPHKATEINCVMIVAYQFSLRILKKGYTLTNAMLVLKELNETHNFSNYKNPYKALELIFKQKL